MKEYHNALKAELIKIKHSKIVGISFMAFSVVPVMGGIFILLIKDPVSLAKSGALATKVNAMGVAANWIFYIELLTQAVGVGGILLFGFVASWIFGREYSDGTAKDLLALPVSRTQILNAKFSLYVLWCTGLAIANLLTGFIIGISLKLSGLHLALVTTSLKTYGCTGLLTLLLGTPVAFLALWGKGYLAPLGFVALVMVFSQIIAATGYGYYFPWSVPGLYSGAGGELKRSLDVFSYSILLFIGIAGYMATITWWKYADQST